jgi:hypothetical protein
MLEARRIFEIAERRHAVTFGLLLCQRRPSDGRGQRSRTKQERFAAC